MVIYSLINCLSTHVSIENLHNETELLRQVAEGDEKAFRFMFDLYRNRIYTFALRFVHLEDFAEEIVQEVFVKIWVNRHKLPELKDTGAWLFIITRNITFNSLKRMARERRMAVELFAQTDQEGAPGDPLLYKEYQRLLREAINKLPPQQKMIFTLTHENGLKREEIATRLNLSPETVKAHLALAMRSVRNYIKRYDNMILFHLIALGIKYFSAN